MKHFSKLVTITTLVGALLAIGAIAFYVFVVGSASNFRLSTAGTDWAEFGDYLGGVLGAGFAGLAFLVLIWTLQLQRQQISQLKEQDKFRELQNALSTHANSLEIVLTKSVPVVYKSARGSEDFLKLLISVAGMGTELPLEQEQQLAFDSVKSALSSDFALFVSGLDTYASLISFYQKRGGDTDIAKVYIARFMLVARMVHSAMPHMGIGLSDEAYKLFGLAT